ncbi:MAG: hypothetical protein EZS28_020764 [Streblomastix strix]|uniref:Uncharacterized protein n=1 Tax=Streblomastix strix TaxID=222440 RepID=A0A5J4VMC1_9EUKA|nr:MAG: hypothetical protein EZS28_020764 [Streblomastix strix]
MVIFYLVLKVEQYGFMIKIGIKVEILFQIKQLLHVMQLRYLMVQQLQELALNIHVGIMFIQQILQLLFQLVILLVDLFVQRTIMQETITLILSIQQLQYLHKIVLVDQLVHSYQINVETNASNIPVVNDVGANGSSAFYAIQDHVHPQQLTYDGNITATKFIKTRGLTTEVLCANGDKKAISDIIGNYVDLTSNQTITGVKTFESLKKTNGTNQQILLADGTNKSITDFNTRVVPRAFQIDPADGVQWMCFAVLTVPNYTSIGSFGCTMNINSTNVVDVFYQIKWNLRIQNGYNRRFEATQFGLTIGLSNESGSANRGLRISADGNTLSFNGSVIAGVCTANGATNGSVNYSAGNPILWGVNSVGTEGGFYSNGNNVFWRAHPVTMGSVPP